MMDIGLFWLLLSWAFFATFTDNTVVCQPGASRKATNGSYVFVYAPNVVLPKDQYRIHVHSFGNRTAQVTASLSGANIDRICEGHNLRRSIPLPPNELRPLILQTGCLRTLSHAQNLTLNVVVKCQSTQTEQWQNFTVRCVPEEKLVLVQFDKPMYKPGETVKYRIIVLDDFLLPDDEQGRTLELTFKDPNNDLVQKETKTPVYANNTSYFDGYLTLNLHPILGTWEMEVALRNQVIKKNFTVKEYVIPRFSIYFNLSDYVTNEETSITGNISARYHYAKPVFGQLHISAVFDFPGFKQLACEEQNIQITKTHDRHRFSCDTRVVQEQIINNKALCVSHPDHAHYFHITAKMVENITGKLINATQRIRFYCQPFRIVTDANAKTGKWFFYPGAPHNLTIHLMNHAGKPYQFPTNTDRRLDVTISGRTSDRGVWINPRSVTRIMPQNGRRKFDFTSVHGANQFARYDMIKLDFAIQNVKGHVKLYAIKPDILVKRSNTAVNLTTDNAIPANFSITILDSTCRNCFTAHYAVLTRFGISDITSIPVDSRVEFDITEAMWPMSKLFAYYIDENGKPKATVMNFEVERVPLRQLALTSRYSSKTKTLCASAVTDAFSLVAFSTVARGLLREVRGQHRYHDFKTVDINRKLNTLKTVSWFRSDGISTSTKAADIFEERAHLVACTFALGSTGQACPPEAKKVSDIRKGDDDSKLFLPETADEDMESTARDDFRDSSLFRVGFTNQEGHIEICEKLPDLMTEWPIVAVGISKQTGLKVNDSASKPVKVLKEVFVDVDLPYQLVRREELHIPVYIFNYGVRAQLITAEYQICSYPVNGPARPSESLWMQTEVSIAKDSVGTFSVNLSRSVVSKLGTIKLKFCLRNATNTSLDILEKEIFVVPKGNKRRAASETQTVQVHSGNKENRSVNFNEEFSHIREESVVPESKNLILHFFADILSPLRTVKSMHQNFEGLIRLPVGCGEQNMALFMPNLFIAKYWKATNVRNVHSDILVKNMQKAYDRQRSFRLRDGSYNAFGDSKAKGSTWLTAYVVRGFASAREFIHVDDKLIEQSLLFLAGQATVNGSFMENGTIVDKRFQGRSGSNEAALTAFTMLAFIEAQQVNSHYAALIRRATDYLESSFEYIKEDPYSLAISSYALFRVNSEQRIKFFRQLNSLAIHVNKFRKYWDPNGSHGHGRSAATAASVETTAYALLACFKSGASNADCGRIVNWLLSKRSPQGGFVSTQDTIVALHALEQAAEKASQTTNVTVKVEMCNGLSESFRLDNRKPLKFVPLNGTCTDPQLISLDGAGDVYYQIQYDYYETIPDTGAFDVTHQVMNYGYGDGTKILKICFRYLRNESPGMVLVEAEALTGYVFPGSTSVEEVTGSSSHANIHELEQVTTEKFSVLIELSEWKQQTVCVKAEIYKIDMDVRFTADRPIKVSRYYEDQATGTTVMYNL